MKKFSMLVVCLFVLSLVFGFAIEGSKGFKSFEEKKDGRVLVNGVEYGDMTDYFMSREFKNNQNRCGAVQTEMPFEAASDCSTSQTVIQNEYWPTDVYVIPVVFHVIYNTSGTGNIPDSRLANQITVLNEDYRAIAGSLGENGFDTHIQFELAGITRTENTNWFNDNDETGYKTALGWNQNEYLNIYVNSASGYLGYAYFPQSSAGNVEDGVVALYSAVGGRDEGSAPYNQGRTLAHEIGHYLGLYHTFQGGCASGYTGGDLLVDTNTEQTAHYGCTQTTTCSTTDPIHNYMAYTDDACMYLFTSEQGNRAVCALVNYRPNLYSILGGPVDPPVANFSATPTTINEGGSVSFSDLSTNNPASWAWSFPGGTPTSSTSQNPSVTYNTAGTYNVTLTATNAGGSDGETKTGYITVNVVVPNPPVANFSASPTAVTEGGSVTFTDLSTNTPTSWAWSFPGGTPATSTAQNPSVTYNTEGTYNVTLTATNAVGNDGETKNAYITVTKQSLTYCASQGNSQRDEWISDVTIGDLSNASGATPYSDFTSLAANVDAGDNVSVNLVPEYSGTTYTEVFTIWIDFNKDGDFGDSGEEVFSGSGTSTVTGSFTIPQSAATVQTRMRVTMKYNSAATPCESFTYGEVEDYTINITAGVVTAPVADFSAAPTSVTEGDTVAFSDDSTNNPTSWAWTFTGGTPSSSTSQNPSVVYNTAGTYNVTLTVTNSAGNDTKTINNYITVTDQPITYCTSKGNNQSDEWIGQVEIGNLINASGASPYTDYTSMTANLTAGASVPVTLTTAYSGTIYTEAWTIWIDFNKDGDFEDAGEQVFTKTSKNSVTGSFTVPSSASGVTTRMRVTMKYSSAATPCQTFTYGEVEDYTVTIQ